MKSIPVYMYAFANDGDKSEVRTVEIPISTTQDLASLEGDELQSILDMVFKYGQNDFQPKQFLSVSVGDVAKVGGRYFMVMGMGWKEISKKKFESLQVPTSQYAYDLFFSEKSGKTASNAKE